MSIELFSLGRTAYALRTKIDRNQRFRSNAVTLTHKFQVERGHPPPIIVAWIVRPMNALQLCR